MVKPLSPWQYDLIHDNEAQTNDATTKRVKLPRDGHLSLIDLIIKCTNGVTSNSCYSNGGGTSGQTLVDTVTQLKIVANGSKELLNITNLEDLIAEATRITGKQPMRTVTEAASAVQVQHIPIYLGRYPDDKLVCIPNGTTSEAAFWDNLELLITYAPTIAATAFATGTFTITVGVKKLVDESPPEGKLVKIFKKKWDYTTVASGDEPKTLTYGNNMSLRSLQVYCYEAGIAEGVDITHLDLKMNPKGGASFQYGKFRWEQLQAHNAMVYQLGDLVYDGRALCSDTDTLTVRINKIKSFNAVSSGYTVTKDIGTTIWAESVAGDQLVLAMWTQADAAAAAYTTDQAVYWLVHTDVLSRYAYLDFDESRALADMIDTGKLSDMTLTLTNGGAGGTVRINEEHIMTAKQFRAT